MRMWPRTLAARSTIFGKYLGNVIYTVGILFRIIRFFPAESNTVFKSEWTRLFRLVRVTVVPRNGTSTREAFCS